MFFAGFAGICAFCGCAVEMSAEAQKVAIVSEKPLDCALLGSENANALDNSGAMSLEALKKSAIVDLKIKTANLGGDLAHILDMQPSWNDAMGGYEYHIKSDIYKCAKDLSESSENSESNKDSAVSQDLAGNSADSKDLKVSKDSQ